MVESRTIGRGCDRGGIEIMEDEDEWSSMGLIHRVDRLGPEAKG